MPYKTKEEQRAHTKKYYEEHKESCYASLKKWRKKNRHKVKEQNKKSKLKMKYGLTIEQRQQIYLNQNGCCACCGKAIPYEEINTDHNHKTGKVRGLICQRCNIGMGFLDNLDFMEKALQYQKLHN